MAILGLTNTNNLSAFMSLTNRRRVFYSYPNGAAPLVGILSLLEDEVTDAPSFGWWEHRFLERATTTLATLITFFTASSATDLASTTGETSPKTLSVSGWTQVRTVADGAKYLRVGDVVAIYDCELTSGTADIKGIITAVDYTNNDRFTMRPIEVPSSTLVTTTGHNNSKVIRVIGSAHEEGGTSNTNQTRYPMNPVNYTQIFRTPFSFSRTALKEPLQWDKTGAYKHTAKDKALDHMVQIENSFLWGVRSTANNTNSDGESVPIRTTGGIEWWLKQWERGNTTNSPAGAFDYRTTGVATANSDANKRIIDLSGSSNTATRADFENYIARVFAKSSNKTNEKLCLCGGGFLSAINACYERQIMTTRTMGMKENETYGMNITGLQTVFGMLWLKTHPLFAERPDMMYNAMILDVNNLKYRYLTDSDTTCLRNRQNNGEDRRRDEWLTECGLELRFPESHMYIKNLQTISA